MRQIKFRGKAKLLIDELNNRGINHSNGWIYGNLIVNGNRPYIVGSLIEANEDYITFEQWVPVIPETVGQFTGLDDRYGRDIYEGDIGWDEHYEVYGVVEYDESNFLFIFENIVDDLYENNKGIEIVGNRYDSPELLEGTE